MNRSKSFGGLASVLVAAPALAAEPHARDLEEIVVTAAPIAVGTGSTAQPASVLGGDTLTLESAPTIGETVARQPGVHSTFYGPAASRPVIRGLGGDRVQVLTDGLATLDASGVSDDHAVAVDPALADQVEVLRGPATLLYGSGAAGGLVNVVTNRLHEERHDGLHGVFEVRGDSALSERALAGRIDGGTGPLALHLDAVWRETGDFEVPDEAGGEVSNTSSETRSGGAGASWIGERATLGAAFSRHDTEYGVPNEDGLLIDLRQDRWDLLARVAVPGGWALRLRASANDYEHAELEPDGEVGTMFVVDGTELRAAASGPLPGGFEATAGLQRQEVELEAAGDEAFVPPSRTRATGFFAFGRRTLGDGALELGIRGDRQEIDAEGFSGYEDEAWNASVGLTWPLGDELTLIGQLVRSERHPSATELTADGPHAATQQFEVGDPALAIEEGWTAELGLRRDGGRVRGEIRAFASRYDGYIFLAPTGDVQDGLPVFMFRQDDARFHGVEAALELTLGERERTVLTFSGDWVRGRLDGGGGDLPRLPPLRLGAELEWRGDALGASVALRRHFEQDDIAAFETETGGYTLLDATLRWRPGWTRADALFFLKATNLLDEVARVHSSPLKDEVPLPGRSLGLGLRIAFGHAGR